MAPAAGGSNLFWFCWWSGGGGHATAKADQKFGVAADYQAGDAAPRSVFVARFQEVVMSVSPKFLPILTRTFARFAIALGLVAASCAQKSDTSVESTTAAVT